MSSSILLSNCPIRGNIKSSQWKPFPQLSKSEWLLEGKMKNSRGTFTLLCCWTSVRKWRSWPEPRSWEDTLETPQSCRALLQFQTDHSWAGNKWQCSQTRTIAGDHVRMKLNPDLSYKYPVWKVLFLIACCTKRHHMGTKNRVYLVDLCMISNGRAKLWQQQ